MEKRATLTAAERNYFSLVSRAVFTNPFSDERIELDRKIAGITEEVSETERIRKVMGVIAAKIETLVKSDRADLNRFSGNERLLVETTFLFDFFHRFMDRFDRFIQEQISAGKRSLKVPFAGEAFRFLHGRGFRQPDTCRYFELVFQLRRAYFFIDRNLVGRSPGMKELRRKLWNNVFTQDIDLYNQYLWDRMEDFSTLILGETGTGKGAAAAAIGRSGLIPFSEEKKTFVESFARSFISLNLSQFPENLIESELFGHKKGAFTGAVEDFQGVFDRCSRYGAIFLDEIGEVSAPIQIKLLQVLQEREFSPVGSHDKHRFNGRVIAATNRSMSELRRGGMLRDDFYYRLCSDVITVPPLRVRISEDDAELDHLLNLLVNRILGRPSEDIVKMVRRNIEEHLGLDYAWPGNVRELEQCVRSVMLNRRYVGSTYLDEAAASDFAETIQTGNLDSRQLLSGYCTLLYRRHGTYEAVAKITRMDRRTVKRYIDQKP